MRLTNGHRYCDNALDIRLYFSYVANIPLDEGRLREGDVPVLDIEKRKLYQVSKGGLNCHGTGDFSADIPNWPFAGRSLFRRQKTPLRWLSAFIRAVAVFVVATIFFWNAVPSGAAQIVPVAKINVAVSSKSIMIADAAPYIEPPTIRLRTQSNFIKFRASSWFRTLSNRASRGDDNIANQFGRYRKVLFCHVCAVLFLDNPPQIAGGQISSIADKNIASDTVIAASEWSNASGFNADERALKHFGFVRLPIAQTDSCLLQRVCEPRDEAGSDSSNGNESIGATEKAKDEGNGTATDYASETRGLIIIGGVIIGLCGGYLLTNTSCDRE